MNTQSVSKQIKRLHHKRMAGGESISLKDFVVEHQAKGNEQSQLVETWFDNKTRKKPAKNKPAAKPTAPVLSLKGGRKK
jgi:hypothetical protein